MLIHPTMTLLAELGLHGMAKGFQELQAQPDNRALEHPDWLAILLERESTMRRRKRFENRAPRCATTPASRMSTSRSRAASIAGSSSSSPAATGSASIAAC